MMQAAGWIHSHEASMQHVWPVRTRTVSHVGNAWVIQGADDFDLDDLNLVRRHFPDRRVTLDGDVITVWPTPLPSRRTPHRPSGSRPGSCASGASESARLHIDIRFRK